MNIYSKLARKPIIFQRLAGINPDEFGLIFKKLEVSFEERCLKKKKIAGRPYGISSLENQLLCLLCYYRTYTTQIFVGFLFGVDTATVCRTIKRIEPLLAKIIKIKIEKELTEKELESLIVDCTEQPIQKPKKKQKKYYSGKKKKHTIKTELVINEKGKILKISNPRPGSIHDLKIRREGKKLPPSREVLVDSGYQGLQKELFNVRLPIKRSKNNPLTEKAKKSNKILAKLRISIEHKIGELKRFQMLTQTYRNPISSYAIKTKIIAGIVNFRNSF